MRNQRDAEVLSLEATSLFELGKLIPPAPPRFLHRLPLVAATSSFNPESILPARFSLQARRTRSIRRLLKGTT